MQRSALVRLLDGVLARPLPVAVGIVIPCLVLGFFGLSAPKDLTFTGVMDREHPLVKRYYEVSDRLQLGGRLPLLLEGPEDRLDEAARALEAPLMALPLVKAVLLALPDAWLERNAPWFVERPLFEDWLALAERPEDAAAAQRLATGLEALQRQAERLRPEGARLVVVRLGEDFMNLEAGGGGYLEIEARTREVLKPFGVTGTYAGLAAVAAQDQSRTLRKVQILSPLSLLLVLLLFRLVERSPWRLLAVAVPMLLSIGVTLGVVWLLTGKLTVMETFFGVMVFGLGVDFALHLMVRLREERARGLPFDEALRATWHSTGAGVIAGAMTTTGAFFVVACAPDPLALHLGLSGGIGLCVCLLLMLTLLPALWALAEKRAPLASSYEPLRVPFVAPVVSHAARHPLPHLAGAVALMLVAVVGMPRYHFETDLRKVFNRDVPALQAIERLQELFEVTPTPWIVLTKDLEEARAVAGRFKASPRFGRVDSAAGLFPADVEERRARLEAVRLELATQKTIYEALLPLGTQTQARQLEGVLKALDGLARAREAGPPRLDELPEALRAELIGPRGELIVSAYVTEPNIDGLRAREERVDAEAVHLDAVGFGLLLEAVMAAERPWIWPVLFGIFLLVFVVLGVDMHRPKLMALALAPVLFGTAVTFGSLCWLGMPFNVLTTLVVPLLIGLGVDDGIHVVHRLRQADDETLEGRVSSVGRAIVMTTATTSVSFSTLLFTDHAGLEGMATVLLVGLPLCLWASITLIPALAVLLGVVPRPR
jgi:uncharacterized protein